MKTLDSQADLFASDATSFAIDKTFATAKRKYLDATSWVEVVPSWITGASALFDSLAAGVPWRQHDRRLFDQIFREPRLTAQYRDLGAVREKPLLEAVSALSRHYGVKYDNLWLNFYRGGEDSTAWHRDRFACQQPECIVPVLTLGATRRFLLKPYKGGASIGFRPTSGDLIVMGGRCQEDWVHGVPKEPGITEPRISVNFQSSVQARKSANP